MPGPDAEELTPRARRRQRERTARVETILAAAETFFATEGFHQTSMERIADEAEVAVGTVYLYFKNKDDLLLQLLDNIGFELRGLLGEAFSAAGAPEEGIRRAGQAFFHDFCARSPARLAIIYRESVGQSAQVEARRKQIFEKLTDDLEGALSRLAEAEGVGFRSERSLAVMASAILGTYERLAVHSLIWGDGEGLEAVADDAVEFVIGGIRQLLR